MSITEKEFAFRRITYDLIESKRLLILTKAHLSYLAKDTPVHDLNIMDFNRCLIPLSSFHTAELIIYTHENMHRVIKRSPSISYDNLLDIMKYLDLKNFTE